MCVYYCVSATIANNITLDILGRLRNNISQAAEMGGTIAHLCCTLRLLSTIGRYLRISFVSWLMDAHSCVILLWFIGYEVRFAFVLFKLMAI